MFYVEGILIKTPQNMQGIVRINLFGELVFSIMTFFCQIWV